MRRLAAFTLLFAALSACDRGPRPGVPFVPVERIVGNERLGWDQTAATAEVLASLRFFIYVDLVRSELQDVVCGSTMGSNGFPCSGRLPQMSAGRHMLQLASAGGEGGASESDLSAPLNVIVMGSATSSSLPFGPSTLLGAGPSTSMAARQDRLAVRAVTTTDRVRLNIETLLTGFTDPADLAFLPDGRLLVAERGGSIRIVRLDRWVERPSDPALVLDDVETRAEAGLLALAPDPQFARNGYVYAVYTTARGFRLARFRESGDVLAERVILFDGIPASRVPPAAVLRFGPDAKLYLGLDDGGNSRRAGDMGSYNGKLLRFNADATTPSDQAGGSPVYGLDVNAPRGLDWGGSSGLVWIAQHGAAVSSPGELRALVRPPRDRTGEPRAQVAARYLLPEGTQPSPIAIYRGTLIPEFRGDLLMAADRGGLLRVRFDAADPLKVISTERLFNEGEEDVRAITVGGDGAIYFSTSTTLMKMAPGPSAR